MTPRLVILSSPSGGGKTTIAQALLAARDDLAYSVSATTRAPRANERDGVDYYFVSTEEFARREAAGEFLETAEYGGHRYGTLRAEVDRLQRAGRHVILDIEVEGAAQVRERRSDVVSIFILPPSVDVLLSRLTARASDEQHEVARRLAEAEGELQQADRYDYIVVNDDVPQAVAEVAAIIDGRAAEPSPRSRQGELIQRLRRDLAGRLRRPPR